MLPLLRGILQGQPASDGSRHGENLSGRLVQCTAACVSSNAMGEHGDGSAAVESSQYGALLNVIRRDLLGRVPIDRDSLDCLGQALIKASRLWAYSKSGSAYPTTTSAALGTTARCIAAPDEDVRYWSLDVLFDAAICRCGSDGGYHSKVQRRFV